MPNLVVVGHLVLDHIHVKNLAFEPSMGGTPTYAGISAAQMGCDVRIVSKVGEDFPEDGARWLASRGLDVTGIRRVHGAWTTSFEIEYEDSERRMRLMGHCEPIMPRDVPKGITADGVLIGPVAQEIPLETLELLSTLSPCTALDPQGYLRRFDEEGKVTDVGDFETGLLKFVKVLKSSRREAALMTGIEEPPEACEILKRLGPEIVIVTGGATESFVMGVGGTFVVPSWISRVIDPTGAGDAFFGAFLAEHLRGREPAWCACVGAASASFVVEDYGPSRFGSREEVFRRATVLFEKVKRIS